MQKKYFEEEDEDKYNIKVNDDQADAICIFDAYWIKSDNQINWE